LLRQISIKNFAIVDSVTLEFGPGFNVMTGETGAGKSLIVDALHFLLGDRIKLDMLRQGEERALVEALFHLPARHKVLGKIKEWGIDVRDGELVVKREFTRSSGKTRSYINGEMATAAMIEELGDSLVDIHGQHEHQAIFNISRHRQLVDDYGHLDPLLQKINDIDQKLSGLVREQKNLGGDAAQIERRIDLLTYQAKELGDSGVLEMNETEMVEKFQLFKHSEKIVKHLTEAQEALDSAEADGGAEGLFGKTLSRLQDSAKMDPSLEDLVKQGDALQESLSQFSFELAKKLESYSFSDGEYQELSDQIDLLNRMKKKYGSSTDEMRTYHEQITAELKGLSGREGRLAALASEIESAAGIYKNLAGELSGKRAKVGAELSQQVEKSLKELGLPHAQLSISVTPVEEADSPIVEKGKRWQLSPLGWDRVEFVFSANPGEPLRPLAKVASGGEASRVMLGLKTVLADSDNIPTLIFDEIDTGVGARTAPAVADLLNRLSKSKQVLCISHLAPIAGLGDWHFQVSKTVEKDMTAVRVSRLTEPERIEELAKMLGGEPISETSRSHARELYVRMRPSS
jgi:DNA repair protein RecN (Recombination protein N)